MNWFNSLFPNRQPDRVTVSLLVTSLFIGIAGSFTIPTLSTFLTLEVGVRPFMLGMYFVASAVSGIIFSQVLAHWSDKGLSRKKLILCCNSLGAVGFVLFAFNRDFYVLLVSSIVFISTSSASLPQLFALAREIMDKRQQKSEKFSSLLRAQIALAWVVGPPLAFYLAEGFGFKFLFLFAAFLYLVLSGVVFFTLPDVKTGLVDRSEPEAAGSIFRDFDLMALSLAFVLMFSANHMYLISMPLYIVKQLSLESYIAGYMMGAAALVEIPVMLLSGSYARKWGKRPLMLLAAASGGLFYFGLLWVESIYGFILLQLLNAIFIGISSALGISYFQDLRPGKMGQVTTLYSNAIKTGGILGGATAGFMADFYGFYSVFIGCCLLTVLAGGIMLNIRDA